MFQGNEINSAVAITALDTFVMVGPFIVTIDATVIALLTPCDFVTVIYVGFDSLFPVS